MRDSEVPSKTDAGRDEIENRARKLPTALRSTLLLVDGQRNVGQLREVIAGLRGPADALDQLLDMGLIAARRDLAFVAAATIPAPVPMPSMDAPEPMPAPAAAVGNAYPLMYSLMSEAVRDHLGLRGYFLQLKIERCTDAAELLTVAPELKTALAKARSLGFAQEFDLRLQAAALDV